MLNGYAKFFICALAVVLSANNALAVRLMTSPATSGGIPDLEFNSFAIAPNGTTVIANGLFNAGLGAGNDRVYSFEIPANLANTASLTQISSQSLSLTYDVDNPPVISPDGMTVLFSHNNVANLGVGVNTIATMPIAGEGPSLPTGLFSGLNNANGNGNLVSPGTSNTDPRFTPNGNTIFFINNSAGSSPTTPQDVLYSVPAGGGATTAITPLTDDLDPDLYDVNNTIVLYATNFSTELKTVPVGGGAATTVALGTPTAPNFDIDGRVLLSNDGLTAFFIGDYDTASRNELYSVPLDGSALPTRISDNLPVGGDVSDFVISPDGTHVAYIANQNDIATREIFYTPVAGGAGNSIRVSDAPTTAYGRNNVQDGGGTLAFASNTQIAYVGDMTTDDVTDFYVVDNTAKGGLVPSENDRIFTYVGANGGDFSVATNWENPTTNLNPDPTALTNTHIVELTVNVNSVTSASTLAFGNGRFGSLTLTAGASLTIPGTGSGIGDLDINDGGTLTLTGNSTVTTGDDVFLGGVINVTGGSITAGGDDLEVQATSSGSFTSTALTAADDVRLAGNVSITGGTVTASGDDIQILGTADGVYSSVTFDAAGDFQVTVNADVTITGSTITTAEDISIEDVTNRLTITGSTLTAAGNLFIDAAALNLVVTDTTISAAGDFEDESSTNLTAGALTLAGNSSLTVDDLREGADLFIDDMSSASIGGADGDDYLGFEGVDSVTGPDGMGSSVTLLSSDAELTVPVLTSFTVDPRNFIINGLTNLTYNQDPLAWNITNWDGTTAETLSVLAASTPGDFDNDGDFDGLDFLLWQRTDATPGGLAAWQANYGNGVLVASAVTAAVPEPSAAFLSTLAMIGFLARRKSGITHTSSC